MLMSSQAMSGDVLGRDLGPLKPSSADEQVDKKPGMVDSGSQGAMASPDREAEGSAREGSAHAKECTWCGSSKTPMWRAGPAGPKTLCNACGVRFARALKSNRVHVEMAKMKERRRHKSPEAHPQRRHEGETRRAEAHADTGATVGRREGASGTRATEHGAGLSGRDAAFTVGKERSMRSGLARTRHRSVKSASHDNLGRFSFSPLLLDPGAPGGALEDKGSGWSGHESVIRPHDAPVPLNKAPQQPIRAPPAAAATMRRQPGMPRSMSFNGATTGRLASRANGALLAQGMWPRMGNQSCREWSGPVTSSHESPLPKKLRVGLGWMEDMPEDDLKGQAEMLMAGGPSVRDVDALMHNNGMEARGWEADPWRHVLAAQGLGDSRMASTYAMEDSTIAEEPEGTHCAHGVSRAALVALGRKPGGGVTHSLMRTRMLDTRPLDSAPPFSFGPPRISSAAPAPLAPSPWDAGAGETPTGGATGLFSALNLSLSRPISDPIPGGGAPFPPMPLVPAPDHFFPHLAAFRPPFPPPLPHGWHGGSAPLPAGDWAKPGPGLPAWPDVSAGLPHWPLATPRISARLDGPDDKGSTPTVPGNMLHPSGWALDQMGQLPDGDHADPGHLGARLDI